MPKKIYDIKPPKVAKKTEKVSKEVLVVEKIKRSNNSIPKKEKRSENRSALRPVLVSIAVVVVLGGIYLFFKLPKADITIWPKLDTLSFKQTITADKSATLIDVKNSVIPAQYFQATKTNSQDFPATGNASNTGYASGTITIYNKFDPSTPFNFKAGTRFISDSGKLFVTLQKVSIPASKKSGNKIIPGSVQVKVQAAASGSDYNIAPANFSIPGLTGTSYYYSVYAVSTSAMTGGYTGKVKKVTDDDIQGAKDVLSKKTATDALSDLKSQISSDYIVLDNAIYSNTTNASTSTKSGAIADSFTYQTTVQASCLAFKKTDLDQFAKNYIISQIPDGKTLLDNSFKIDYSVGIVDVSGGKETLNLNFSSDAYQNIDKNSLALSLLGENTSQINQIINNKLGDQVSKIKINFWPFWVTSAPNNQNVVNIYLKF